MNIHEYQAKAVLREFGVPVPRGHAAFSAAEAVKAAGDLGTAAMAEMLSGFRHWNEARAEETIASFARAGDLLERAEPSPTAARLDRHSKAAALATER